MMTNDFKSLVVNGVKHSTDNWGTGVILHDPTTNCILLAKRTDTGTYGTPGGKVEMGESPRDGVLRECMEESNVKINSMICYGDNLHTSPYGKNWVDFLFYSNDFDASALKNQESEMEEWSWVPVSEAFGMDLFPPSRTGLEMAIDQGIMTNVNPAVVDISDTVQNPLHYIPFVECPTSASQIMDSPPCQYSYVEPEQIFTTHQWLSWD